MTLRPIRRRAARLRRDADGSAIVEFTIVLPILALMLIASVEAASYFWSRSRANDAATAAGDLTTQYSFVSDSSIRTIFAAADAIISENRNTREAVLDYSVRLTSALACECEDDPDRFCYRTLWSHVYAGGEMDEGREFESTVEGVPSDIAIDLNDTIIVAEMTYRYSPALRFVFTEAEIDVEETLYFRPRFSERVVHVGSQAQEIELRCPEE